PSPALVTYRPPAVAVDRLDRVLRGSLLHRLDDGTGGVQRRDARDPALDRGTANLQPVENLLVSRARRVDDTADCFGEDQIQHMRRATPDALGRALDRDAGTLDHGRGSLGRIELVAHPREAVDHVDRSDLVIVRERDEDITGLWQRKPGCDQRLE